MSQQTKKEFAALYILAVGMLLTVGVLHAREMINDTMASIARADAVVSSPMYAPSERRAQEARVARR